MRELGFDPGPARSPSPDFLVEQCEEARELGASGWPRLGGGAFCREMGALGKGARKGCWRACVFPHCPLVAARAWPLGSASSELGNFGLVVAVTRGFPGG